MTTLHSLQALQVLAQTLRQEFAERLRGVEQERDEWKAKFEQAELDGNNWANKYQQEQLKVQNLEALQRVAEIKTTEITAQKVESPEPQSGPEQLKIESADSSVETNTSNPENYADLKRKYRILQRKYDKLDSWYREAKIQLSTIKTELASKGEAWREWHEWWNTQKHHLRVKSTSPTKKQVGDVNTDGQTEPLGSHGEDKTGVVDKDTSLDGVFRKSDGPEKEPASVSPSFNKFNSPKSTHTKGAHSNDTVDPFPKATPDNSELALPNSAPRIRDFDDITNAMETEVKTTTKPLEVVEILDIPESPVTSAAKAALPLGNVQATPITINSSPPVSPSNKSTTSLNSRFKSSSTRTSDLKKKKRDYPNMKYFTEDGTDGINPQPDSQNDEEDDGAIGALLAGRPPPFLAKATSLPPQPKMLAPPAPSTPAPTSRPNSKGRARELIDLDSDSGTSSSGGDAKRQKRERGHSEPRLRRPIFSPDHAAKNKGKGRYSESISVRNAGDPPRLQDFAIDPANNQGVSHPFNDVVRGKEARKNLPATACQDCAKFHEFHGPTAGPSTCNHIQQVSRHRHQWEPEPKPPGFWKSDWWTDDEFQNNRAESKRLEEERVKKIAEEAARGDGRWKERKT